MIQDVYVPKIPSLQSLHTRHKHPSPTRNSPDFVVLPLGLPEPQQKVVGKHTESVATSTYTLSMPPLYAAMHSLHLSIANVRESWHVCSNAGIWVHELISAHWLVASGLSGSRRNITSRPGAALTANFQIGARTSKGR